MLKLMKLSLTMIYLLLAACTSPEPQLRHLSPQDVIVAFGDSLTFGTGAGPEQSYPFILEKIIGLRVINAGVPGDETSGGLSRIADVLEKEKPQLVILCLGGNDQLRRRTPEQIKENLKNIIKLIRSAGADILLLAPPAPSIGLSVPDFYRALGKEMGVPVDDTTLAGLLKQPEMKSDYIHLNAAGYRALAESIVHTLKKSGALAS